MKGVLIMLLIAPGSIIEAIDRCAKIWAGFPELDTVNVSTLDKLIAAVTAAGGEPSRGTG